MSRQPKDENNNAIPILPLKPSGGQKVTIAAGSARSTAVTTQAITVHATANCFIEIGDATNVINTSVKFTGKQIWDSTNNMPLWAQGSSAVSPWVDGTGAVKITPA